MRLRTLAQPRGAAAGVARRRTLLFQGTLRPRCGGSSAIPWRRGRLGRGSTRNFLKLKLLEIQGNEDEGGQVIAQGIPEVQVLPRVVRRRVQQRTVPLADAPCAAGYFSGANFRANS